MNNKMAINTYLSIIESKNQNKQTSKTETESQIQRIFWWLSHKRGVRGMDEKGKGIKDTN